MVHDRAFAKQLHVGGIDPRSRQQAAMHQPYVRARQLRAWKCLADFGQERVHVARGDGEPIGVAIVRVVTGTHDRGVTPRKRETETDRGRVLHSLARSAAPA